MDHFASFAATLRQRRKALDLTQPELARRVGCAVGTIQRLEQGTLRPSRPFARRLADTLELPAEQRDPFVSLARGVAREAAAPIEAGVPAMTALPWPLPAPLTPVIGRDGDVAAVAARLLHPAVRAFTLIGPGGIGKTRLALAVAEHVAPRFANGVLWLDLASIREAAHVPAALAHALGLTDLHGQALVPRLQAALRPRHLLLILDNFEHVTAAAPLVVAVLAAAPQLTVLLTSRVVAGVYGEHTFPVAPLTLPALDPTTPPERLGEVAAVQLFVERARAADPAFVLSGRNAHAVSVLCHELDGLPLAIELAAARTRVLPPSVLLERLTQAQHGRLEVLTGGPRSAPARQHTLRATLQWSYDLLAAPHQQLFRRLGVFVGGCRLHAVETVCRDEPESAETLLEGLHALLESSLVQRGEDVDGAPRFAMLETIREYALEQLIASGEHARLQGRHAAYVLSVAEAEPPAPDAAQVGRWWDRLEVEQANVRAALAWSRNAGETAYLVRLAVAMGGFWRMRGHLRAARDWLAQAVARQAVEVASRPTAPAQLLHARALLALAGVAHWQGDIGAAGPLLAQSLALLRELDALTDLLNVLNLCGMDQVFQGDYPRARTLLNESLALAGGRGEDRHVVLLSGLSLWFLGILEHSAGDVEQARVVYGQSLLRFRTTQDAWCIAGVLAFDAVVALDQGDVRGAAGELGESVRLLQAMGERWQSVHTLEAVARMGTVRAQQDVGDPRPWAARAARLFGAAEAQRAALSAPLLAIHRQSRIQGVGAVRELLAPPEVAAAWADGQALTLEHAMADALDAAECASNDG